MYLIGFYDWLLMGSIVVIGLIVLTHALGWQRIGLICQCAIILINGTLMMQRFGLDGVMIQLFLGLGLGLVSFFVSLVMTVSSCVWVSFFRNFFGLLFEWRCQFCRLIGPHMIIFYGQQLVTAIWEELLWRVVIQGVLIQWFGQCAIVITACLFWAMHWHLFSKNIWRMADLLLFSIVMGIVFEWTHWVILVFMIHFVRNVGIVGYRLSLNE